MLRHFILVLLSALAFGQTVIPAHCMDDACTRTVIHVDASSKMEAIEHTSHWVALRWNGSAGCEYYNVYRADATGGPYVQMNTYPLYAQGWVDTQVVSSMTYFYVATAYGNAQESTYSNEAQATIP